MLVIDLAEITEQFEQIDTCLRSVYIHSGNGECLAALTNLKKIHELTVALLNHQHNQVINHDINSR